MDNMSAMNSLLGSSETTKNVKKKIEKRQTDISLLQEDSVRSSLQIHQKKKQEEHATGLKIKELETALKIKEQETALNLKARENDLKVREHESALKIKEQEALLNLREQENVLMHKQQENAMRLREQEAAFKLKEEENALNLQKQKQRDELEMKERTLQFFVNSMKACIEASPGQVLDERTKLQFKDNISNLSFGTKPTARSNLSVPVSISSIAAELGLVFTCGEYSAIGKDVKEQYVKKYGENPSKHSQHVDGAVRMVNSYTVKDRDMIVCAIKRSQDHKENPTKFFKRRKLLPCNY